MIADLGSWAGGFAGLPLTGGAEWAANLANFITSMVASARLKDIIGTPPKYAFDAATLLTKLQSMSPNDYVNLPVSQMQRKAAESLAQALSSAAKSSKMVVLSGASYKSTGPATTWSSITSVTLDMESLEKAEQALVNKLSSAPMTDNPGDAEAPKAIREFFLTLSYTITGLNSTSPSPTTLVAKYVNLI